MGMKDWIRKKTVGSVKAEARRALFRQDAKAAIAKVRAPILAKAEVATKTREAAALERQAMMMTPGAEYLQYAHRSAVLGDILAKPGTKAKAKAEARVSAAEAATRTFETQADYVQKTFAELKSDIIRMTEQLPYLRANAAGASRELEEKWNRSAAGMFLGDVASAAWDGTKAKVKYATTLPDFGYKPKTKWTGMEKWDLLVPTAIADFILPKSVKPVVRQNVGRGVAAATWLGSGVAAGYAGSSAVTSVAEGIKADDKASLEKNNKAFVEEQTVAPKLLSDSGLLKHYIRTKLLPDYQRLSMSTNVEDRAYAVDLTTKRLAQMEGTDALNALIEERRASILRGDSGDDARLEAFDRMTTFQKLGGE